MPRLSKLFTIVGNITRTLRVQGPRAFISQIVMLGRKRIYLRQCHAVKIETWHPRWPQPKQPIPERVKNARILFISSYDYGASKRYRVDNLCEQFISHGIHAQWIYEVEIFEQLKTIAASNIIVFQRVPMDPAIQYICEMSRLHAIAIVFEIDDYLLDESVVLDHPGVVGASVALADYYRSYSVKLQQTFMKARYFIGATRPLAQFAQRRGKMNFVIRNGLNHFQIERARKVLERLPEHGPHIRIGYQPGTKTHNDDFGVIAPVMEHILRDFPQAIFVIHGYLDLPSTFARFDNRVELHHFVPWIKLIDITATLDIVLAPLVVGNIFNESKSALKYFESALVGIPVVASPTDDFQQAIKNGVNGFLAFTEDEWYTTIARLVQDPELRLQIGSAARADALANYSPDVQYEHTLEIFSTIWHNHLTSLPS
jgi:glycosyltransferase involved in cell wall biosynthesis